MRLVLDFDGTVTERDTLDIVLERFGDAEVYERAEAELDAGRMTLNEVISAEFATVTAPLDEVVAYVVEHARVRPGFAELARARHPLVVSSGFHELIEPVLEREGVLDAVELRANRVDARPDGWQRALPRGGDLRGLRRAVQARRPARRRGRLRRRRPLRLLRRARCRPGLRDGWPRALPGRARRGRSSR